MVLRAPQSTPAGSDSPTAEKAGLPFSIREAGKEASGREEAPGKEASGGGAAAPPGGGPGGAEALRRQERCPSGSAVRLPQKPEGGLRPELLCSRVRASRPHPRFG